MIHHENLLSLLRVCMFESVPLSVSVSLQCVYMCKCNCKKDKDHDSTKERLLFFLFSIYKRTVGTLLSVYLLSCKV